MSQQEKSLASFRKRSNGLQARVRRKRLFLYNQNIFNAFCCDWARQVESDIDKGAFISRVDAENTTLAELLIRYLYVITPHKKVSKLKLVASKPG